MRILIFGAKGMLGHKLVQRLESDHDVWGTIRGDFDSVARFGIFHHERIIENIDAASAGSVESAIDAVRPEVVINAVGIIKQLEEAKNVVRSLEINSIFPQRLAEFAARGDFRLITVSTDCVFDGATGNYSEEDTPNATDLYGRSKYLGEVTGPGALTIRTSIIGRELDSRHSLVEWVLSNRGKTIDGYVNAIYSGFPTIVFADIISFLIAEHKELSGLYHIASAPINKFELLKMIDRYYRADINVVASETLKIDRSLNADKFNKLTGFRPPEWEQMIMEMAADTTPYDTWKK